MDDKTYSCLATKYGWITQSMTICSPGIVSSWSKDPGERKKAEEGWKEQIDYQNELKKRTPQKLWI